MPFGDDVIIIPLTLGLYLDFHLELGRDMFARGFDDNLQFILGQEIFPFQSIR